MKQQLIEPFRVISNLAGISIATLQPNQTIEHHAHATMHEFFFVLQGQGEIMRNNMNYVAMPGTFVYVAPGELHGFVVTQQDQPLIFLNVAITTDAVPK